MPYVIRALDSNASLPSLEHAIQQAEELGFTACCLATGTVGGEAANLLTLAHGVSEGTVHLTEIDADGSDHQQSVDVTAAAKDRTLISYGAVFVGGVSQDLVLTRS